MEMGFDCVLLNSAIALADCPRPDGARLCARRPGRKLCLSGRSIAAPRHGQPSTPTLGYAVLASAIALKQRRFNAASLSRLIKWWLVAVTLISKPKPPYSNSQTTSLIRTLHPGNLDLPGDIHRPQVGHRANGCSCCPAIFQAHTW